jgi:hypothetical protein
LTQILAEVWVCFSDGSRAWLLTGMVSVALSRLHNAPVLWLNGYGTDGALIEIGAWTVDPDGKWRRCDNRDANLDG